MQIDRAAWSVISSRKQGHTHRVLSLRVKSGKSHPQKPINASIEMWQLIYKFIVSENMKAHKQNRRQ